MDPVLKADTYLWPVDKLILAYFGFAAIVIFGWWNAIPGAALLLTAHIVGTGLLLYEVRRPNRASWAFRHWYPLVYVAFCYREMAVFIPAVRQRFADEWLAALDRSLWHTNPTVWLERITEPPLTEYLQIIYSLFVPAVLLVAFHLWRSRRFFEFQYYAFLIALGYLVSYAGYLAVPARGPRFLLAHLQHLPLRGLWSFSTLQRVLDRMESFHYDCFPSGHTELTILAWWSTRRFTNPWFWGYFVYTLSIIFATVYLRYHYTIDLFAGAATAAILICVAPVLYRMLLGRRDWKVGRR